MREWDVTNWALRITTTTVANVHQGQPLPIARFLVVAVPLVLLSVLWMVKTRGRS